MGAVLGVCVLFLWGWVPFGWVPAVGFSGRWQVLLVGFGLVGFQVPSRPLRFCVALWVL